jgi:putative tryptophan/tyrosine transport system substrate-binding protein
MKLAGTILLTSLALSLLAAPLTAEAQLPPKVSQVGLLWFGSRSSESSSIEAFMAGLRDLGYVEGQNVVLHSRFAEGNLDRLPPRPPSLSASAWM